MDSSIGMNESMDNSIPVQNVTSPVESSNTSTHVVAEKTFTQNDVNEIVKRAKQDAVERDRRLRETQPEYAQSKYADNFQQNNQSKTQNDEERIRQLVAQETQRQREEMEKKVALEQHQQRLKQIADKFLSKVATGKETYQDFESVVGDIDYERFPHTVHLLAENVDNVADVLYELGKNRMRMGQLETLAYLSPKDAIKEVTRLAKSIKENKEAANIKLPKEPLSQMRPSINGMGNGADRTVSDFKQMFRF